MMLDGIPPASREDTLPRLRPAPESAIQSTQKHVAVVDVTGKPR